MAFGTGSGLLFIGGQDKTIVRLAGAITENRAGSSGSAVADFVSVLARGSGADVICTDSGSLVFAAAPASRAVPLVLRSTLSAAVLQLPGVLDLPSNGQTLEVTPQYDN